MAKTFEHVKIGDFIQITNPEKSWFYSTPTVKFSDYTATITNVEIYGDYRIISFRNSKFNHTIKIYKYSTIGYIHIPERRWENYRTRMNKIFIDRYDLNEKNSSVRKYSRTGKLKYNYTFELI